MHVLPSTLDPEVSEGDGLPGVVCPSCFAQLELSHQFKSQVEKADRILREELSINKFLHFEDESAEYEMENKVMEIHTDLDFQEDEAGGMLSGSAEKNTEHVSQPEKKVSQEKDLCTTRNRCDTSTKIKTKREKQKVKDKTGNYSVQKYRKCEICNEICKSRQLLYLHKKIHGDIHKCDICGKIFSSVLRVENHRRIHFDERPFSCEQCGKSFKMEISLKTHIRCVHNENPVSCALCGKVYKTKGGLHFHKSTRHAKNGPACVCEICGKRFMENSALCSHRITHISKPVSCDICSKTYPHPRALRSHKSSVHLSSKRFRCDVCGKFYKNSSVLKIHKVTHSGEKPHVCSICGLGFTQKSATKNHMKVHTGLEPYSCQHCGQSFKWKQTFDKHLSKCSKKQNTNNSVFPKHQDITEISDAITINSDNAGILHNTEII